MQKFGHVLTDERESRKRSRLSTTLTLLAGLLLAPLVYEGSLMAVAQWRGLKGPVPTVHTPVIDALRIGWRWASNDLSTVAAPVFRTSSWKPAFVLPFALFWCALAALFLRRV